MNSRVMWCGRCVLLPNEPVAVGHLSPEEDLGGKRPDLKVSSNKTLRAASVVCYVVSDGRRVRNAAVGLDVRDDTVRSGFIRCLAEFRTDELVLFHAYT